METSEQLLQAWRVAADDLGIEVEPFRDATLVKHFGRTAGTMCVSLEAAEVPELEREAKNRKMFFSQLGPSYLHYDRTHFIETLNDWGWHADATPPPWYSAEPWTT